MPEEKKANNTRFKNILIREDGLEGKVEVIAEWSVWDCEKARWSEAPPVVLRGACLSALYPKIEFCIGQISENQKNPNWLKPFKPAGYKNDFELDLASGSRNHGRFTFSPVPIGRIYFAANEKDEWKRIIYGSILHTGCKRLTYKTIKYIVVDDEGRDKDGNALDDGVNNTHWETGDSHAKCSFNLMQLIGLPADVETGYVDEGKPIQFRAALRGSPSNPGWVGKGTIAYNPRLDNSGYDLVIPLSSLKGNKPALGNHEGKLLFGLVFEAEERQAKPGWMLFQWFDFDTLDQDGIIAKMIQKCQRLASAYNSIVDLAEILRIDRTLAEAEEQGSDVMQSELEYENTMVRIIQSDKKGVLLLHPYVVRRVKERMQAMWLNLAKAAGVRFYSVMCQPDESLAHYHVVLKDGRIVGQRVFCAPDFEEGEYIVFCNPMRHWGDVQLWKNKHEGIYVNAVGILAAPRKLLLNLGRDTDGDFIQIIKSDAYPNMRDAIAQFTQSPIVEKFPKVALKGNLRQIAINSMTDLTGVVASLLGRARAAKAENLVLEIPPGGEQKAPEEMRIIDFLSQELQIAVDSIKSAYPNNVNGLDAVKKFLDNYGATVPWLKDFKDPACYRDRPCLVNPNAVDTVSRIVQTVNSYWKAPDLKFDSSPRTYEKVLFGDVEHDPEQFSYAMSHRASYRADMAKAIAFKEENEGSTRMIREVAEKTKASRQQILDVPKAPGETYSAISWVSAYWKASHQAETGDAGLVFMIFADEIIERLMEMKESEAKVITCYGCQYGKWSASSRAPWAGQEVQIRAYIAEISGVQKLALEMKWDGAKVQLGFHHLGLVGEMYRPYLSIGQTETRKIYSTRFVGDKTKEVTLFHPSMTEEEINNFLNSR